MSLFFPIEFTSTKLLIVFSYIQVLARCYVITPKTVADDIELFNSNQSLLNQDKYIKPWMDYIHYSLDKSLLHCLQRTEELSEMWR